MYELDFYGVRIPENLTQPKQDKPSYNPHYGTAVRLRTQYDIGRRRIEAGEYNFDDVVEAVEQGVNFYTGELLT